MANEPERGSLGDFSAADRAHGTHGKGDFREQDTGEKTPKPGNERVREQLAKNPEDAARKLEGELGDAGWGSAGSGDSSVDARSRKHKGSGGT